MALGGLFPDSPTKLVGVALVVLLVLAVVNNVDAIGNIVRKR